MTEVGEARPADDSADTALRTNAAFRVRLRQRLRSWDWLVIAACLPALAVPAYILAFVLTGSPMSELDYFMMLDHVVGPDGSITPAGLLVHQNEHLILLPKLIYLLNTALTGGSNVALGVFAWLASAATVALLLVAQRPWLRGRRSITILVFWLLMIYLFPLQAIHHYAVGMSGTAWVTANLLAVGAILAMTTDRWVVSGTLAVLATLTYGTGMAVWPALVVIVVMRRRWSWRDAVLLVLGALVVALAIATAGAGHPYEPKSPLGGAVPLANALVGAQAAVVPAGSLFTDRVPAAIVVGFVLTAAYVALAVVSFRRRCAGTVVSWVAIGAFAMSAFAMFSLSRGALESMELFSHSRYMGMSGLFVLSVSMLLLMLFPGRRLVAWVIGLAAASTLIASLDTLAQFEESTRRTQDTTAVAAVLGVGHAVIPGFGPNTEAALRSLGHYPFDGTFSGDCGLLQEPLPTVPVRDEDRVSGTIHRYRPTDEAPLPFTAGRSDVAWIDGSISSVAPVECLLAIDDADVVVGAAAVQRGRPVDLRPSQEQRKWAGVTLRPESGGLRVVARISGEPDFLLLQSTVKTAAP